MGTFVHSLHLRVFCTRPQPRSQRYKKARTITAREAAWGLAM